jgi:hypothetical protein
MVKVSLGSLQEEFGFGVNFNERNPNGSGTGKKPDVA